MIRKVNLTFNLLIISLLMFSAAPAYAYLDSGTGSVIIQMLFAGVAGLLAILKLYWEKVKAGWRRFCHFFKCKKTDDNKPLSHLSTSPDKKSDDKTR